jgi:phosphoglycolate phosphatase-like HAD superfamily hydrolase
LETSFGLRGGLNGVRLDGKTDLQIVREVFDKLGVNSEISEASARDFFVKYLKFLRRELEIVGQSYQVLPGVKELLGRLSKSPSFLLGVATGNIEEGARLKLEHGRLRHFFALGGYGSDSESRTELIRIAIRRARELASVGSTIVVGDTPRDIQHGRQAGAQVVAVASGYYSLSELEVHGPDLSVESCEPIEPILHFLSAAK